jgi:hypothetical protein
MLTMLIKRSTMQVDAQAFYQSCGFVQINESTSSGFELLPKLISVTQVQEENCGFAWMLPASDEYAMTPLMRLCSGSQLTLLCWKNRLLRYKHWLQGAITKVHSFGANTLPLHFLWKRV